MVSKIGSKKQMLSAIDPDRSWSSCMTALIARYLAALDRADRQDDDVAEAKTVRLKEKIEGDHPLPRDPTLLAATP